MPTVGDIVELFCGERSGRWRQFTVTGADPSTGTLVAGGCHRTMSGYGTEWRWPGQVSP
jgi:hypothetical protein